MPKTPLCVCSLVNKLILLGVHNLAGEVYFKHSAKCKSKTSGEYEFVGAGYQKQEKTKLDEPSLKGEHSM